jgi:uncharacterized metal-binding protein YceD (DUF177 family)
VSRPELVVAVSDLEIGPKVVDFTLSELWLRTVLEGSGAEPRGAGRLRAELAKNGREVLVRGKVEVAISMPCVVTTDPLPFDLAPEILLLLSPATTPGPGAKTSPGAKGKSATDPRPAPNPSKKRAKKAWSDEQQLSSQDASRDTFSGDQVVLDDFVREFILLELPMYPRRSDLPSPDDAASAPAPEPAGSAVIDPRLKPLAELAERLASKKAKE